MHSKISIVNWSVPKTWWDWVSAPLSTAVWFRSFGVCYTRDGSNITQGMKIVNGVTIFDRGEPATVPEGFPPIPTNNSRWGMKFVEVGDEKRWEPATEEDFINSEMQRLGGSRETVLEMVTRRKSLANPCHRTGTASCDGECPDPSTFCYSINTGPHAYCTCIR